MSRAGWEGGLDGQPTRKLRPLLCLQQLLRGCQVTTTLDRPNSSPGCLLPAGPKTLGGVAPISIFKILCSFLCVAACVALAIILAVQGKWAARGVAGPRLGMLACEGMHSRHAGHAAELQHDVPHCGW